MSHGRDWNVVSHAATVPSIVMVTISLFTEARITAGQTTFQYLHTPDYMSSDPSKVSGSETL